MIPFPPGFELRKDCLLLSLFNALVLGLLVFIVVPWWVMMMSLASIGWMAPCHRLAGSSLGGGGPDGLRGLKGLLFASLSLSFRSSFDLDLSSLRTGDLFLESPLVSSCPLSSRRLLLLRDLSALLLLIPELLARPPVSASSDFVFLSFCGLLDFFFGSSSGSFSATGSSLVSPFSGAVG